MSTALPTGGAPSAAPALLRRGGHPGDAVFKVAVYGAALVVLLAAALILYEVVAPAQPTISRDGIGFVTGSRWDPRVNVFGALPFIYGTLVTSILALVLALPIGLGIAIYLAREGLGWFRAPLGTAVELLAAVPSVVFGIWALFVLVPVMRDSVEPALAHLAFIPIFAGPLSGTSFFTAGVVLAIMILPTLASISRDVIRTVPRELREGSLALGATEAETTLKVVLPAARTGITGAIILALGRAMGETIAVTMVIGNAPQMTAHLFSPGYTLASIIANEFPEAQGRLFISALIEMAAVLLLLSALVNAVARVLLVRGTARARAAR